MTLLFLGISFMHSPLQALDLIRDGKAQSVIVIGKNTSPAVRDAAEKLQKLVCGNADPPGFLYALYKSDFPLEGTGLDRECI